MKFWFNTFNFKSYFSYNSRIKTSLCIIVLILTKAFFLSQCSMQNRNLQDTIRIDIFSINCKWGFSSFHSESPYLPRNSCKGYFQAENHPKLQKLVAQFQYKDNLCWVGTPTTRGWLVTENKQKCFKSIVK